MDELSDRLSSLGLLAEEDVPAGVERERHRGVAEAFRDDLRICYSCSGSPATFLEVTQPLGGYPYC